jgi:hypothetical protein
MKASYTPIQQPPLDYKFPEDIDIDMPALALCLKPNSAQWEWLTETRQWHPLQMQTAGHACQQHQFLATILEPKSVAVLRAMQRLEDKWYGMNVGMWGEASLDILLEYRQSLDQELGVDCNWSYVDFEEALYPIDATKEHLEKLCTDQLPEDLDDLITWPSDFQRFVGAMNRWHLFVLGRNSD